MKCRRAEARSKTITYYAGGKSTKLTNEQAPRLGVCDISPSSDMKFLVYAKRDERGNSIWKLKMSDGKEERICTAPSHAMGFMGQTSDGKELLWIKLSFRTKIGMIENPFE